MICIAKWLDRKMSLARKDAPVILFASIVASKYPEWVLPPFVKSLLLKSASATVATREL
jgi:hypothetical protein